MPTLLIELSRLSGSVGGPLTLARSARFEGVENVALRVISEKRIDEMTPAGSRSKAQGCPRCMRATPALYP